MLWTIVVVLFILWLLGFTGIFSALGAFIHIFLVVAVVLLVIQLLTGRKTL